MADKVLKTSGTSCLPIKSLTSTTLGGEGVLDQLLSTLRVHLDREFNDQRIVGSNYSAAYQAMYMETLKLSVDYVLSKERQYYEIVLLEQEFDQKAERHPKELELLTVQIDTLTSKLPKELELLDAQVRQMETQADLAIQELALKTVQVTIANKELEIKVKELELSERQLELMDQKIVSEKAQTDGTVIGTDSVLGVNLDVLKAQEKGFEQKALQSLTDSMLSTWLTRANNDAAEINLENGLTDAAIGEVLQALRLSAGVPSSP